jgi:hypothetical protein
VVARAVYRVRVTPANVVDRRWRPEARHSARHDGKHYGLVLKRGDESRDVRVLIADSATAPGVPDLIKRAVRSKGKTAVRHVLNEIGDADPPTEITVSSVDVHWDH